MLRKSPYMVPRRFVCQQHGHLSRQGRRLLVFTQRTMARRWAEQNLEPALYAVRNARTDEVARPYCLQRKSRLEIVG